jgi:hypothetical protein
MNDCVGGDTEQHVHTQLPRTMRTHSCRHAANTDRVLEDERRATSWLSTRRERLSACRCARHVWNTCSRVFRFTVDIMR